MSILCSKCSTTWANLHSQDEEGDEQYEVCPECRTDQFLELSEEEEACIKCPFTGKIIDARTGKQREKPEEPYTAPVVKMRPPRETAEERDARELAAIDAYHQSGDNAAYFKTIKKHKNG